MTESVPYSPLNVAGNVAAVPTVCGNDQRFVKYHFQGAGMEPQLSTFGGRLRAARQAMWERFGLDMNQTDLARHAGDVTRATVSDWERGAYEPGRETVARLAAVLGVTVAWLREGAGERYSGAAPRLREAPKKARPTRKRRATGESADQKRQKGA